MEGVTGVTHDSRSVKPGFAFVAVSGFKRDGAEFAGEALRRGASLVVAGKGHERVQHLPTGDVPFHDATVVDELLEELETRER